jgi:hypothetical protein
MMFLTMIFLTTRSPPNGLFLEWGKSLFLIPSDTTLLTISAPWKHIPMRSSDNLPSHTSVVLKKLLLSFTGLLERSPFIMFIWDVIRLWPNL